MRDLRKDDRRSRNQTWNRNEQKLHRHRQLTAADVHRVAALHEDTAHDLASAMLGGDTFQAECIVRRVLREAVGKRHEATKSADLPRWLERAVVRACRERRLERQGLEREVIVVTRRARRAFEGSRGSGGGGGRGGERKLEEVVVADGIGCDDAGAVS